jgi:hypothetical protein
VRLIVRLDCSAETVVAVCSLCAWRDGPTTRHTAARLATAHRVAEHPGQAASKAVRALAAAR